MSPLSQASIEEFLQRLGATVAEPTDFYLLGDTALTWLGSLRPTLDIETRPAVTEAQREQQAQTQTKAG